MEKKIAEKKEAIGKLIEYRWLYMQQLEKCDSELSSLSEKNGRIENGGNISKSYYAQIEVKHIGDS